MMMIDDERPFRVGAKTDPRSLKIKRPQVRNHCVIKVTACVDDLVGR